MRIIRPLLMILLGGLLCRGEIPAAGDPEVFFRYLYRVHLELQGVSKGQSTLASTAEQLHAPIGTLAVLDAAYQNAANALSKIQSETQAYLDSQVRQKLLPEPAVLNQFYARRLKVIEQIRAELVSTLGPNQWSTINAFIDGEYRQHTRRSSVR